ncbi:Mblk-1-related factor 1 [Lamellibrachia satsuma]|nr:Mblk-1-related factor 1 [Lamellibrachia satsuma]
MVDCSRQRCVQERRSFRRELLTWVKKVPILVGLEEVTRTILGKDVSSTLLQPFYNLEPLTADDWRPQTKCQFCDEETAFADDILQQTSQELSEIDRARAKFLQHISQLNSLHVNGLTLTPDEPLDLSASSSHSDTDEIQTSQNPVELKVPQIHSKHGKRRENGGKRNYTDQELSAAVSDIRSGKLGTRRAAALYGVPRSTLRNKIFRLDTGSPQNWLATDILQHAGDLPPELLATNFSEWEKKLQQLRRKHDLGAGHKRPFEERVGCGTLPRVDREWPHCGTVSGDAAEVFGGNGVNNVELQIPSYKPMRNSKCEEAPPANRSPALGVANSTRPNKTIGESLKDIIAKSIAQKVRTRAMLNNASKASPMQKFGSENGHWEPPPKSNGVATELAPEPKKPKLAAKAPKANMTTEDEDGKLGRRHKQTRPKRGQYRKYNSQLLMEAVQSVQRGEMSVHRAGSFYGVPHSTLEYKVKERHLLRQKKAREIQKKSFDDATSDVRSVSDDSTPLEAPSGGEDPANLPLYPLSGYVPLSFGWPPFIKGSPGGGVPNMHGAGFPPYGTEFGLNTSASELLKKLQQKVQANSALETSASDDVPTTDSIVSAGVSGDAQVTVK